MYTVARRLGLLLAVIVSLMVIVNTSPAADRPNIVLIISDDQAWNDYGFMGHEHIQTPRLDQLSKQGLTFRRGYVPCSLCRASLMAMFTGLYPHQNGITSNDPPAPAAANGKQRGRGPQFAKLREEMNQYVTKSPTLARVLGEHGYMSLQTGKWWEGHWRNGGFTHGMTQGERHGDAGLDIGRKTMQPVFDFINESQQAGKPFFVWYAPMLPHSPHNPPERLLNKYRSVAPSDSVAKYWACVEWFDEGCGQLLDHLAERKLSDNTIVAYVTDNGWLQDPTADKYAVKSKQSQYDGGLRTPIMIRWPGKIAPQTSEALAMSIDLMPTLLHAANITPPAGLPGINLLDPAAVAARKTIYGECFTHNAVDLHKPATSLKWRWCIDGQLKLIVPETANVPGEVVELYDLAADPWERMNLAAERSAEVNRLQKLLDAWWPGK
ncbi:MAG: sulfatase [Planctomycetaceae bacterium]|nr:sulfatase [Planctomycetaceae bacterium]